MKNLLNRRQRNQSLFALQGINALEWPSYGRRRITADLRRQGWTVNPKRVYRVMREDNLLCVRKRKFVVTTGSNHGRNIYRLRSRFRRSNVWAMLHIWNAHSRAL